LLLAFNRWFEEETHCRITYSSAPVEHLIAVIASRSQQVDALVGRSGPGWQDLKERGRLASECQVFALDPYVMITLLGNPAGIRDLTDLKRADVRTVYSPTSSGPSGSVVQYLLEAADRVISPGLWEGYVCNAIEAHDCGWKVFPPVIEGRAHVSVTRLSMTTAPETRGKVEVIPIPAKVMAAMLRGQGACPQRVARLAGGRSPELAERYVADLLGEVGAAYCAHHGFIHHLARDAARYRPLFQMGVEKGGAQRDSGATETPSPEREGGRGQGRRQGRGGVANSRGRRSEE
jgi:molybdate transport system substrate-binding protein